MSVSRRRSTDQDVVDVASRGRDEGAAMGDCGGDERVVLVWSSRPSDEGKCSEEPGRVRTQRSLQSGRRGPSVGELARCVFGVDVRLADQDRFRSSQRATTEIVPGRETAERAAPQDQSVFLRGRSGRGRSRQSARGVLVVGAGGPSARRARRVRGAEDGGRGRCSGSGARASGDGLFLGWPWPWEIRGRSG